MSTEAEKSTTGGRRLVVLRDDGSIIESTDTPKKRNSDLVNEKITAIQNICKELFQRMEYMENKILEHGSQLESVKKTIKILDEEIIDLKKESD